MTKPELVNRQKKKEETVMSNWRFMLFANPYFFWLLLAIPLMNRDIYLFQLISVARISGLSSFTGFLGYVQR